MKKLIAILSLLFINLLVSADVIANSHATKGFECAGKTDEGKSFSIAVSFNVLESFPSQDSVNLNIDGEEYGRYGHHGFSYAPGVRVMRESIGYGENILITNPDIDGKVNIDLKNISSSKNSSSNISLRASGIKCKYLNIEDFGDLSGLELKKDRPFETLAIDALAIGYENTLLRLVDILQHLIEPSSDVFLTYQGLFLSNNVDLQGRFDSIRSGWTQILSSMLNTPTISASVSAELVAQFYQKHPEAAADIAAITLGNWQRIALDTVSARKLFVKLAPQFNIVFAKKRYDFYSALSSVIMPKTLGNLPERMHALELLFSSVENDNNLSGMLIVVYKDLEADEFEDIVQNVIPRLLKAPNYGPSTIEMLLSIASKQSKPEHRKAIEGLVGDQAEFN
ncbi:MAG: hypothetical protein Q7U04_17425 [Bacteriovorax sp.]|nr:hypothetical protein [Bacteriovorax sp.]